jgi:hypothetical protein
VQEKGRPGESSIQKSGPKGTAALQGHLNFPKILALAPESSHLEFFLPYSKLLISEGQKKILEGPKQTFNWKKLP